MNHIFGTAKPVLAWLGEDIGDVCATLPEDIWQAERFRGRSSGYNVMNGNVNVAAGDKRKKFTRLHRFEPVSTTEVETFLRLCRAITALCERDYWHRVWIVPGSFCCAATCLMLRWAAHSLEGFEQHLWRPVEFVPITKLA
jgi:hypothetical protein